MRRELTSLMGGKRAVKILTFHNFSYWFSKFDRTYARNDHFFDSDYHMIRRRRRRTVTKGKNQHLKSTLSLQRHVTTMSAERLWSSEDNQKSDDGNDHTTK
ncbi:uncharacterized protein ACN2A1_008210 isoform 1-T1 [Glossina fuscipes fuscipes]